MLMKKGTKILRHKDERNLNLVRYQEIGIRHDCNKDGYIRPDAYKNLRKGKSHNKIRGTQFEIEI